MGSMVSTTSDMPTTGLYARPLTAVGPTPGVLVDRANPTASTSTSYIANVDAHIVAATADGFGTATANNPGFVTVTVPRAQSSSTTTTATASPQTNGLSHSRPPGH
ncbi:uncharacterized protein BDZ99DRAFT_457559 [Mytilinidion resinicola]|uniref:Uncharacterized protein n=1 Tax=Mytilinidion resinicola TaxID=574789 RepID=A0A6A6ZA57_9PEZI|nr:uncharacterized protein BDZ99DRAFT_457559 [Mytilinidion resinicola]KAF2818001.1 hypothetical protein BDZ99DRAFT_457559 [Mytilinidion resinicola]